MQNTPDAFSALLSDPSALASVAQLLSSMQKTAPEPSAPPPSPEPPPPESAAGEGNSAPAPDLTGMLGSLLSRPEVLSALPQIVSMLSGLGGGAAAPPTATPSLLGALGQKEHKPPPVLDRRCALLSALKPYLPEDKRTAVDTVIRVIEIMSLIK